jgi:hypothetical protein
MAVKLKDVLHGVLDTNKPPTKYDLVLPEPTIEYYDVELKDRVEVHYTALSGGIFWGHDVVIDETCDKPHLRLKPQFDYANALPFDEL